MKRESQAIREYAVRDHLEGLQPFFTEHIDRMKVGKISVVPVDCIHCGSSGFCDCPMCGLLRTKELTPCSMCNYPAHRAWLEVTRPVEDWHAKEKELTGGLE